MAKVTKKAPAKVKSPSKKAKLEAPEVLKVAEAPEVAEAPVAAVEVATKLVVTSKFIVDLSAAFLSAATAALDGIDDAYSVGRLGQGWSAFTNEEIDIALWFEKNVPIETTICEVGCGIGQMSVLLSALGYQVIGVDADAVRIAVAQKVADVLALDAKFECGHYPDVAPECGLLVTTHIMSGWWAAQPGTESEKAARFFTRPAIICPKVWFEASSSPRTAEQCEQLAHEFQAMGLSIDRISESIWRVARA